MENEELRRQWDTVVTDAVDSIKVEVLRRICELYLTIQGFSFAASCLELYKQWTKQQLQKSKKLTDGTADD